MTFTPGSHPHRDTASEAGLKDDAGMRNPHVERRRDLDFEARLLDRHSPPEFAEAVKARLERGERVFGNQWAARPAVDLIAEAIEEAADLAAWSLLALQRLGDAPGDRVASAQLVGAISLAAATHHYLDSAREQAEVEL